MPAYEYELLSGDRIVARVLINLPVQDRDSVTVQRCSVPRSVQVSLPKTGKQHQANDVLRCLRRSEARQGSTSAFHKKLGMPAEQYKRAWSESTL